jgi:hypothetical protein
MKGCESAPFFMAAIHKKNQLTEEAPEPKNICSHIPDKIKKVKFSKVRLGITKPSR